MGEGPREGLVPPIKPQTAGNDDTSQFEKYPDSAEDRPRRSTIATKLFEDFREAPPFDDIDYTHAVPEDDETVQYRGGGGGGQGVGVCRAPRAISRAASPYFGELE